MEILARTVKRSEEWITGRRYLDMREPGEQRGEEREEAEKGMLMER